MPLLNETPAIDVTNVRAVRRAQQVAAHDVLTKRRADFLGHALFSSGKHDGVSDLSQRRFSICHNDDIKHNHKQLAQACDAGDAQLIGGGVNDEPPCPSRRAELCRPPPGIFGLQTSTYQYILARISRGQTNWCNTATTARHPKNLQQMDKQKHAQRSHKTTHHRYTCTFLRNNTFTHTHTQEHLPRERSLSPRSTV